MLSIRPTAVSSNSHQPRVHTPGPELMRSSGGPSTRIMLIPNLCLDSVKRPKTRLGSENSLPGLQFFLLNTVKWKVAEEMKYESSRALQHPRRLAPYTVCLHRILKYCRKALLQCRKAFPNRPCSFTYTHLRRT